SRAVAAAAEVADLRAGCRDRPGGRTRSCARAHRRWQRWWTLPDDERGAANLRGAGRQPARAVGKWQTRDHGRAQRGDELLEHAGGGGCPPRERRRQPAEPARAGAGAQSADADGAADRVALPTSARPLARVEPALPGLA